MTTVQNKTAEAHFFDQYGESGYTSLTEKGFQRILQEFKPELELVRDGRLLDIGCGTGAMTSLLQRDGLELFGLDISPKCIEFASAKFPKITFQTGDIESAPYADESFDFVLLSGVMHHFPDPSKMVTECHRILKTGGKLFSFDPHIQNPFMWAYRCKKSPFYSSKGVTENEEPIGRRQIRKAFEGTFFRKVEIRAISGVSFETVESRLSGLLLPVYNTIDQMLDWSLIRNYLGSFIITIAEK